MDHPLRIIGGHNAPPFTYSFQVALFINDAHFLCGGTLISSHAVLTAAHCFNDDPFLMFPYSVGVYRHLVYSTDLGEHVCARTIPVRKVIRHPLFKAQTYQNDVAVLMLEDDVPCEVTALPVIRLDETGDWWAGARASILGWGVTSSTSSAFSNVLQIAEVTVHAQATCEERYTHCSGCVYDGGMLCASKPGIDACTGDSGGPLFLYPDGNGVPVQIGITSWGVACAEAGWPGVYTRVASYASWIKQQAGLFPPPPRPPPPSPSPPPVQPLPRHPPPSPLPPLPPLPEAGVAILAGNDRSSTPQPLACVTPNVAQSLTMVNAQAIAVQCCLRNVHGVEACVRTTNGRRDGCLGGVPPHEFTYSQARRHCHINGFSLCAQSCVDQGCTYNNYPVWTRLPCSLPPPVPPMFLPAPSPLASLFSFATPPPQQTPPPQLSPPSPLSVAQTPLPSGSTPLEPTTAPFPLLPVSLPPSWPPSVPPVMPALVPPLRPPLISPVLPHPQPTLQPPPQSLLQPFRPPLSQPPPWTLNQTALPAPLQSPASAPSEFPRQPPLRPPAQPLDDSPAELALDTKDDADLLDLAVRTAVFATCAIAFVGMLVFSIVSMRCFAAHWACVGQRLGTSRQESTLASGQLAGDTDEPADAEAKRTRSCAGPTAYQRAISSIVEERTFEVTQWSSSRRSDMLFSANI